MTDPAILRQQNMRNMARLNDYQAQFDQQMAKAAAAIASLEQTAATAASVIATSAGDRAQLNTRVAALEQATASTTALNALTARVAALEARKLTSHTGTAAVPAIAVGANTNVTITWPTPFPDAGYVCSDPVFSSALVGKATGGVTAQGAAGCTVRVTAGVRVGVGSTVSVVAIRLG